MIERHQLIGKRSRCCGAIIKVESVWKQYREGRELLSCSLFCSECFKPTFPAGEPPDWPEPRKPDLSGPDEHAGFSDWCEEEAERRWPEEEDWKR